MSADGSIWVFLDNFFSQEWVFQHCSRLTRSAKVLKDTSFHISKYQQNSTFNADYHDKTLPEASFKAGINVLYIKPTFSLSWETLFELAALKKRPNVWVCEYLFPEPLSRMLCKKIIYGKVVKTDVSN